MKRLPVKSLVTFRSVSKAWKSIIDSPRFINNHTQKNQRQHHRLLKDDDTFSQHPVRNVPVSVEQLKELKTVGTSRGLLCLSGISGVDGRDKKTAVIWNPSLGKSISVGVPGPIGVLGFGVRPDNFDPMIVNYCFFESRCRAMVFTLSERVWRVPRGKLPSESIYFTFLFPSATNDRYIYWKAYESQTSINLVVAFDMVSEDFSEISLPQSVAHVEFEDFPISMIKDSLAVLEYYDDAEEQVCNVWMMAEDGVSKKFTKLFTINTLAAASYTFVLGFTKNRQPIVETMEHSPTRSVEVYEPRTGSIKNLGINVEDGSFFCCSYTETLLLLDQLDRQFIKFQLQ